MIDEPETGTTDAPTQPCPDCAAATQRQVAVAAAIGVALGAVAFYAITRAAAR